MRILSALCLCSILTLTGCAGAQKFLVGEAVELGIEKYLESPVLGDMVSEVIKGNPDVVNEQTLKLAIGEIDDKLGNKLDPWQEGAGAAGLLALYTLLRNKGLFGSSSRAQT